MLYAIVGMLVIILDQIVKFWVDKNINLTAPVKDLIPGVISLVKVQNDGAAFSFLAGGGARIWFIVLTGIFALVVVLALVTNFISGKFGRWCLVLVTAGGLSNCIDRILYGSVLDMFRIELFNFAVFNVADIFITVFAILFILYILFGGEKEKAEPDEFDEEDKEEADRPVRTKKNRKERFIREDEVEPERVPAKKPVEYNYSTSNVSKQGRDTRSAMNERASSQEFESFFAQKKAEAPAKPVKTKPASSFFSTAPETDKPDVMPVSTKSSAFDSNDPFAEWDRANGKAPAVSKPSVPKVETPVSDFIEPIPEKAVAKPVKEAPSFSDDFDLDSILNEFK